MYSGSFAARERPPCFPLPEEPSQAQVSACRFRPFPFDYPGKPMRTVPTGLFTVADTACTLRQGIFNVTDSGE